jgi:hypothetical protein
MHKPGDVLKVGYWIYNGTIKCRVEIQFSIIRYGSGDYEDQPEWRDDQPGEWYVVSYSTPIDPNKCPSDWQIKQGEPTLAEAILKAEATLRECQLKWEA